MLTTGFKSANSPALPSGQTQAGWGEVNVSECERMVSAVLGGSLFLGGLSHGRATGLMAMIAGGALVFRGLSGHCVLYQALGIQGAEDRRDESQKSQPQPLNQSTGQQGSETPRRENQASANWQASSNSQPTKQPSESEPRAQATPPASSDTGHQKLAHPQPDKPQGVRNRTETTSQAGTDPRSGAKQVIQNEPSETDALRGNR